MAEVVEKAIEEVSTAHVCERLAIYWNMIFAILTLLLSVSIALAVYSMDIVLIASLLLLLRVFILSIANTEEFSKRLDPLAYSAQTLISTRLPKRYGMIVLSALLTLSISYLSYTLNSRPLALLAFEMANLLLYLALTPKPYSIAGTVMAFLVTSPFLLAIALSGNIPSLSPFILILISDLGYILSINLKGVRECVTVMKSIAS